MAVPAPHPLPGKFNSVVAFLPQVAHGTSVLSGHQHLAYGNVSCLGQAPVVSCLRITSHNDKPLPGS